MRIKSLFFALFLAVIFVGCSTSEANNEEKIIAELREQMELAEREVAEAIQQIRDDSGESSQSVRRKIEDARREMERAQRKLEELYAERERSDGEYENEYYTSETGGDKERVRIRVRTGRGEDHDYGRHEDNGRDHDRDHNFDFDKDFDFDFDLNIDGETIERIAGRIEITLGKLSEAFANRDDVKAVDMDDLRGLFPRSVAGMKRVNMNSSSKGAFGFRISQTEAEYEGERTEMTLTVVDLGSIGSIVRGGFDLFEAEIDRESDDGYVRTTKINGHPAKIHFEKGRHYDSLEVVVMIADRFVFAMEVEGTDLSEELLEDVLDDFPIADIEDLK